MELLAKELGGLDYPVPVSDRWLKVGLTAAPCTLLVVASVFWASGAPFLLTFAGAFASIQLVEPYRRAVSAIAGHLAEARAQQYSGIGWARVRWSFLASAEWYEGRRPVGYSRVGRARARRRFPRLARRWRRHFHDLSGRIRDPRDGSVPPAARPAWRYPRRNTYSWSSWRSFVRRGRSVFTRVTRSMVGLPPVLASCLLEGLLQSQPSVRFQKWRAERLLTTVGCELIRASRLTDGDLAVRTLAAQSGMEYRRPKIRPEWVLANRALGPQV